VKKAKSELNDWGQRPEYKRADFGKLVRGKYANLSKADREKVESEYHRMKPENFDKALSRRKRRTAAIVSRSMPKPKTEKKRADLSRIADCIPKIHSRSQILRGNARQPALQSPVGTKCL
jgi:hypothetical protein